MSRRRTETGGRAGTCPSGNSSPAPLTRSRHPSVKTTPKCLCGLKGSGSTTASLLTHEEKLKFEGKRKVLACALAYYQAQTLPARTHTWICTFPAVLGSHRRQLVFVQHAGRVNINNDAVFPRVICAQTAASRLETFVSIMSNFKKNSSGGIRSVRKRAGGQGRMMGARAE